MTESKLPLMIGIGTRIRKSPYYESNLKYGVTGFTVYNKMYLPTGFSDPLKLELSIMTFALSILPGVDLNLTLFLRPILSSESDLTFSDISFDISIY